REAVDAVRARDEFLSIASHELRTPLSSLRLHIEMLARKTEGPEPSQDQLKEKFGVIARQVGRLSDLVNQLLDVSRIAAGRLRLALEELDLRAIVTDVVARFDEDAARAGAPVIVKTGAPVIGRWDRLRIEQVVTNLLGNALKFGAGRPVELSIAMAD